MNGGADLHVGTCRVVLLLRLNWSRVEPFVRPFCHYAFKWQLIRLLVVDFQPHHKVTVLLDEKSLGQPERKGLSPYSAPYREIIRVLVCASLPSDALQVIR
jgi:hypothetical protein